MARGKWKLSVLLAINIFGPVAYDICFGSCTAREFLKFFVDNLFFKMNKYPGNNSIVCMDSCRLHDNYSFVQMVNSFDIIILKLAKYKPYHNLAEWAFNAIKSIVRSFAIDDNDPMVTITALVTAITLLEGRDWKSPLVQAGVLPSSLI